MENLIPGISSDYCRAVPIRLIIDTEKGVTHINDELIFQVEKPRLTFHHRRSLCNFSGNTVLNMSKKIRSIHNRWQVFKGDSKDSKDLIFSVKRSSSKSPHKDSINLEVFLANNTEEHDWDYKVIAGSGKSSCDIYNRHSSTILVKMMITNNGVFVGEVKPNVNFAFIVALITIVDEMIFNKSNSKAGKVFQGTLTAIDGIAAVASVGGLVEVAFRDVDGDGDDDGDND